MGFKELADKFTAHPQETGESYQDHFHFTFKMAMRLIYVGLIILVHGIFPFIFTRKASAEIMKIYQIMTSRIPGKSNAENDFHYVI